MGPRGFLEFLDYSSPQGLQERKQWRPTFNLYLPHNLRRNQRRIHNSV